jgi:hypothetical protein
MEVLMATKREKDFLHDLDKRMAILEDSMDRLESNHLNHLQKQIDKIDARIWAIILGAVLQLVGIISIFIGMSN